ncbi:hypothetical protein [Marinobacterium jannaschii]|uniref:hypothetical protein n=1 Tax=Marinobacterium jannaschii TaxID=64970 RepID=UPI000488BB69|nr:hypothetical protein [Marinobacterium jannaschii]
MVFWDGGFSVPPALFPLVFDNDSADLLLVMLQPLQRDRVPRSARTINNRIAEIGFQAPLLRELASLAAQQQRAASRWTSFGAEDRALRLLRFHLLESDAFIASQERESKYDTRLAFLQPLRERRWAATAAVIWRGGFSPGLILSQVMGAWRCRVYNRGTLNGRGYGEETAGS